MPHKPLSPNMMPVLGTQFVPFDDRIHPRGASTPEDALSPAVVRLDDVSKSFGSQPVLNRVSFALRPREVLALCGPSGCGKTTLIRTIAGLAPFDSGFLTVAETVIPAGTQYPTRLFGQIGVVFQEHNLFPHMTVLGNVTLALRESKRVPSSQAKERGMAELERMGVAGLAERYPVQISTGEQQRIAIARALALDPVLLLLDEPTSSLDPERVEEVCDRVLALAEGGTTMLLVTHNTQLARNAASTFALLERGNLVVSKDPTVLNSLHHSVR